MSAQDGNAGHFLAGWLAFIRQSILMSADRPFDLMECVKLDMDALEKQFPDSHATPQQRAQLRRDRGLVVGFDDSERPRTNAKREILWSRNGVIAISVVEVKHLLPAKLAE